MRPVLCPVLVGRRWELGLLDDALASIGRGCGSTVFVVGEAGIGKSRLIREVRHRASHAGVRVLVGRAVEEAAPVGYRALAEAVMSALRDSGPPAAADLRPFRGALGRLIPDWRGDDVVDSSVVALAEGLLRLLRVVGGAAGVVLVLEDLHWADAETLSAVEYLADNLRSERVLCVATLRGTAGSALTLARRLEDRAAATVLELGPLAPSDVEAMAEACLAVPYPDEDVHHLLANWTGGVPLLVEELLAALVSAGRLTREPDRWVVHGSLEPAVPEGFAEGVRHRLRVLGSAVEGVVGAGAVLGVGFDSALVAEVVGMEESDALAQLRLAVDAQLLLAGPEGFRFRHALTRDAVLGGLLPGEHAALARSALTAVQAAHPKLEGAWCEVAAELAIRAADRNRAGGLLLEAGRRALDGGAVASALAAFERADALSEDPEQRAEVGGHLVQASVLAGRPAEAVAAGRALLVSLDAIAAPAARRADVHLSLAGAEVVAGHWEEADRHLAAARPLLGADDARRARLLALEAQAALGGRRSDDAARAAQKALALADREGLAEVACEALAVIGRCARLAQLGEARDAFRRLLAVAERNGLTVWRMRAVHELATIEMLDDHRVDGLHRARQLAVDLGALADVVTLDIQIASIHQARFEPDQTLEAALRAEAAARRYHLDLLIPTALVWQASSHAQANRHAEMEAALERALPLAGGDLDVVGAAWGVCRATWSLLGDDRTRAIRELDTAMAVVNQSAATAPFAFRGLWALLHTLRHDGTKAAEEARGSGATVYRGNRGYLALADAVALGRGGDREAANAAARQGDADLAATGGFRHLARRLAAEAALDEGWGDPVPWLQEAAAYFETTGHDRLVAACRSLLRRAGVRLPRRGVGISTVPPDLRALGVTSREMDVLLLVGDGLSNVEIGRRLYLSPRTVEKHVASLLSKCAQSNRAHLVAFAARHPAIRD